MIFCGISRDFSLENEGQYDTIGAFWDEMSALYGMENLCGLGHRWQNGTISYAIGLKTGNIEGANLRIILPDDNWVITEGETHNLKEIYDGIYKDGRLKYEVETFSKDGKCKIAYYR